MRHNDVIPRYFIISDVRSDVRNCVKIWSAESAKDVSGSSPSLLQVVTGENSLVLRLLMQQDLGLVLVALGLGAALVGLVHQVARVGVLLGLLHQGKSAQNDLPDVPRTIKRG